MDMLAQNAFSHPVSETLMIPLWIRATESQRADAIINDPYAEAIVDRLIGESQADFSLVKGKTASQIGIAIRADHFDTLVRRSLERWGDPVVVHVGCGLDTRFLRTDNGLATQVEIDLPPVMALREHFLPASPRNPHIAMSALDTTWMSQLRQQYAGRHFVFVAEGLLFYFAEEDVRHFLNSLADHFPGADLHFDSCSTWMAKRSNRLHDILRNRRASFRSGVDDPLDVCRWEPRLRLENVRYYLDSHHRRWGWRNMYRLIPALAKTFKMISCSIRE